MTADELILIDSSKVRSSSDLMRIYKERYKEYFGKYPDCAGCTFTTDWVKFVNVVKSGKAPLMGKQSNFKNQIMENTYQLKKKEGKILSYKKENRTHRSYDVKASQQFLSEYLTYGTKEELADRRKMFKDIPAAEQVEEKKAPETKKETKEAKQPAGKKQTGNKKTAKPKKADESVADPVNDEPSTDPTAPAPERDTTAEAKQTEDDHAVNVSEASEE